MPKTRALLVGHAGDTDMMKKFLEEFGVLPENIQVLPYEDTTAGAINTCLTQLIGGIPTGSIFYFRGPGCQLDEAGTPKTFVGDLLGGMDSVDSTLASEGYHEGSLIRTEVSNMVERIKALDIELTRAKEQARAWAWLFDGYYHLEGATENWTGPRCPTAVEAVLEAWKVAPNYLTNKVMQEEHDVWDGDQEYWVAGLIPAEDIRKRMAELDAKFPARRKP